MSPRRAATTSSIPPPLPGGVRCNPRLKADPRPRAELSQDAYRSAVAALRSLLLAVDALRDEGFDHAGIRARYFELLNVADKAAGTLAHLDSLNDQLWEGK